MKLIRSILISALAIYAASFLLSGFEVKGAVAAIVAAIVLGILNHTVKPVVTVITFPLNVLTLGLFSFVINGIMIKLMAYFTNGIYVKNLMSGIIAAIVIAIVNSILLSILGDSKKRR